MSKLGYGRKITMTYTDAEVYHGTWTLANSSCAEWSVANGGSASVVLDDYRDANGINMITMVTNSNPATVTTKEKHYFSNGEQVHFRNVLGMVELNGNSYTVANATDYTFELFGTDTTNYNTFGVNVLSSGGKATPWPP